MNLYVETSAVLNWLLGQADASTVARALNAAQNPITSELTLAESWRGLARLKAGGRDRAQMDSLVEQLRRASRSWTLAPMQLGLLRGLMNEFPREPVRTLDAIHLCTALRLRPDVSDLTFLSLDVRVRENALALGFPVIP
ncbi:MAG: type II toxin-antitoxin system VapC family toxin [Candidatus Eremiobacteraeota bacterium]|nr:type II toxin-antitoxin system VapC family toxin [Candidatus Eremiobacteraeota bacterium]MCW5871685.1 type II toxin-antitoxin system VapC family toxin [Candidatus Eremiobacteraeota bacterium]